MDNLILFMRAYVLGIDINQHYYSDYLLKNYINLNKAASVQSRNNRTHKSHQRLSGSQKEHA